MPRAFSMFADINQYSHANQAREHGRAAGRDEWQRYPGHRYQVDHAADIQESLDRDPRNDADSQGRAIEIRRRTGNQQAAIEEEEVEEDEQAADNETGLLGDDWENRIAPDLGQIHILLAAFANSPSEPGTGTNSNQGLVDLIAFVLRAIARILETAETIGLIGVIKVHHEQDCQQAENADRQDMGKLAAAGEKNHDGGKDDDEQGPEIRLGGHKQADDG